MNKIEHSFRVGKYEDTETLCKKQLKSDSLKGQTQTLFHVRIYTLLGLACENQRRNLDAQHAFRLALYTAQSFSDVSSGHISKALLEQGEFYLRNAFFSQAEEFARQAFFTLDTLKQRNYTLLTQVLIQGGNILWRTGNLSESENWLNRAILNQEDSLSDKQMDKIRPALILACIRTTRGNYASAENAFEKYLPLLLKQSSLDDPVYREALFHQALLYYETGKINKALIRLTDILSYLRINEPNYVACTRMICSIYAKKGDFKSSLILAEKTFHKFEDIVEVKDDLYIQSYANLLNMYHISGDSASAEKYYERASMIARKSTGSNNIPYAWVLGEKGMFLLKIGRFKDAVAHLNKSAEIYSQKSGNTSLPFANALFRLGYANASIGRYNIAQPYYLKALNIYNLHLEPEHPLFTDANDKTAALYSMVARYDEAEKYLLPFYTNTISRMQGADADQPENAYASMRLATLMSTKERFAESDSLFTQALCFAEKLNGYDRFYRAEIYREWGEMLKDKGAYNLSMEKLIQASDEYLSMPFKGKLPDAFQKRNMVAYAINKTRKAEVLIETSQFNASAPYLIEAIDLFKAYQGEDFIPYAEALSLMARLNFHLGHYTEAEKQSIRAKEIMAYVAGNFHPIYGEALMTHADIELAMGRNDEAEQLLITALRITKERLGEKHKLYSQQLSDLAYLSYIRKDFELSEERLRNALTLAEALDRPGLQIAALTRIRLAMILIEEAKYNEAEKLLYQALNILKNSGEEFRQMEAQTEFVLGQLYLELGKWETSRIHFQICQNINQAILPANHPDQHMTLINLALIQWQLGNISIARQEFISVLDKHLIQMQKMFSGLSEKEKARYWNRVQSDFHLYAQFVAETSVTHPELILDLLNYQIKTKAILLYCSTLLKSKTINSGNYAQLYEKWADLSGQLARLSSKTRNEILNEGHNLQKLESEINKTEIQLSEKVADFEGLRLQIEMNWSHLENKLLPTDAAIEIIRINGLSTLRLPDRYVALLMRKGQLPEIIHLGAAEDLEKKFLHNYKRSLQEKMYDPYSYIHYWQAFSSKLQGVDRIFFSVDGVYNLINPETFKNQENIYLADKYHIVRISNLKEILDYELSLTTKKISRSNKSVVIIGGADIYLDRNTLSRTVPVDGYPDLPGTLIEAQMVHDLFSQNKWKTTLLTGGNATEAGLKNAGNAGVLHIATHGYFINKQHVTGGRYFMGMEGGYLARHPMLRSGLLFSGSGSTLHGLRTNTTEEDDGILTALEVMGMNLENTELVVLSACETGLGDVVNGEGVMGLQRGFRMAGVQSVLMTLWKIPDDITSELMEYFYTYWLKGEGRAEAFKNAQLKFRNKYPDPLEWGAFILNGI